MVQKYGRQIGGEAPGVSTRHAKNASIGNLGSLSSHKFRGSMEGLIKYKNAVVEMSGSGYGSASNQRARYSSRSMPIPSNNYATLGSGSGIRHKSSLGFMPSKFSSAARLGR